MSHTGEAPGKGEYICVICEEVVALKNDSDALPRCPRCDATTFRFKTA